MAISRKGISSSSRILVIVQRGAGFGRLEIAGIRNQYVGGSLNARGNATRTRNGVRDFANALTAIMHVAGVAAGDTIGSSAMRSSTGDDNKTFAGVGDGTNCGVSAYVVFARRRAMN